MKKIIYITLCIMIQQIRYFKSWNIRVFRLRVFREKSFVFWRPCLYLKESMILTVGHVAKQKSWNIRLGWRWGREPQCCRWSDPEIGPATSATWQPSSIKYYYGGIINWKGYFTVLFGQYLSCIIFWYQAKSTDSTSLQLVEKSQLDRSSVAPNAYPSKVSQSFKGPSQSIFDNVACQKRIQPFGDMVQCDQSHSILVGQDSVPCF